MPDRPLWLPRRHYPPATQAIFHSCRMLARALGVAAEDVLWSLVGHPTRIDAFIHPVLTRPTTWFLSLRFVQEFCFFPQFGRHCSGLKCLNNALFLRKAIKSWVLELKMMHEAPKSLVSTAPLILKAKRACFRREPNLMSCCIPDTAVCVIFSLAAILEAGTGPFFKHGNGN